jgi:phage tail-like protein
MAVQAFSRQIDPFKTFKFLLYMGTSTTPLAGVSKVSPLKRTTEVVTNRSGGMESTQIVSPGHSKFEPITLERGLALNRDLEEWAQAVFSPDGDAGVSLAKMRRNLTLSLLNLQGQAAMKWQIFGCWVSEYTAVPELDANANAFAFETIVLQNHGFIRDPDFQVEDPSIFTAA